MVVHKEADQDFDFAWRHCKLHLLDLWRFIYLQLILKGEGALQNFQALKTKDYQVLRSFWQVYQCA